MPRRERASSNRARRAAPSLSILSTALAMAWLATPMSIARAQEPGPEGDVAEVPSLDGSGNNREHPDRGAAGTHYRRLGPPNYADGLGEPAQGPNARYLSNRIFADRAQNLFSENGVTQWAWTWGQFVDHTIGLRAIGEEPLFTAFDANDPLELFAHGDGVLRAARSAVAPGTGAPGTDSPREQTNVNSSYLDAFAVYGGDAARLEWLREGPVDGDLSNNGAKLLLTDAGYLPRATERDDASSAPVMELQGQLLGARDADERLVVAGDTRANENIALTAVQTLFAREHNRIVDLLPADWSEQRRFDAARLLVIALQQRITYEEFLPAVGVTLAPARGYRPEADASVSNEFATVGYRAHSMIHGEIEIETSAARYGDAEIASFRAEGIEVENVGDDAAMAVPLNIAFGNPQLLTALGLGPVLQGIAGEAQYRNDEQIDGQLRNVLFQLPDERVEDPGACLDGPTLNECYLLVGDIGVLDIVRGRDHGMPSYADMRAVYGLAPVDSFAALTGESSEEFPTDDALVDIADPLNDPDILDFVALVDADGALLPMGTEAADGDAVSGLRRTPLAARLKAIHGDVARLDAFVGMVSEPHLPGSELGELQHAMWRAQFEALRDGDRFHYLWSEPLRELENELLGLRGHADDPDERRHATRGQRLGERLTARRGVGNETDGTADGGLGSLDWRRTLAVVIVDNTELGDGDLPDDVFLVGAP